MMIKYKKDLSANKIADTAAGTLEIHCKLIYSCAAATHRLLRSDNVFKLVPKYPLSPRKKDFFIKVVL